MTSSTLSELLICALNKTNPKLNKSVTLLFTVRFEPWLIYFFNLHYLFTPIWKLDLSGNAPHLAEYPCTDSLKANLYPLNIAHVVKPFYTQLLIYINSHKERYFLQHIGPNYAIQIGSLHVVSPNCNGTWHHFNVI